MTSSHNFLSMIFGIFGKFGIEILCERKKIVDFFHRTNLIEKNRFFLSKKIDRKKKLTENIFRAKKSDRTYFSIRGIIVKNTPFYKKSPLFLPKNFRPKAENFSGSEISLKRPKMRVLSIFSPPQGEIFWDLAFS